MFVLASIPFIIWVVIGFFDSKDDWMVLFRVVWWLCKWVALPTIGVILAMALISNSSMSNAQLVDLVTLILFVPMFVLLAPLGLIAIVTGILVKLGIVQMKAKPQR